MAQQIGERDIAEVVDSFSHYVRGSGHTAYRIAVAYRAQAEEVERLGGLIGAKDSIIVKQYEEIERLRKRGVTREDIAEICAIWRSGPVKVRTIEEVLELALRDKGLLIEDAAQPVQEPPRKPTRAEVEDQIAQIVDDVWDVDVTPRKIARVVCDYLASKGMVEDAPKSQLEGVIGVSLKEQPAEADPLKVDVTKGYPPDEMEVRMAHNALAEDVEADYDCLEARVNQLADSIERHTETEAKALNEAFGKVYERIAALEQRIDTVRDAVFGGIDALEHGLQALRNELIAMPLSQPAEQEAWPRLPVELPRKVVLPHYREGKEEKASLLADIVVAINQHADQMVAIRAALRVKEAV